MFRTISFSALMVPLVILTVIAGDRKAPPDAGLIEKRFSQAWKESQESRKSYKWTASTEVIRKGKTIQLLVESVTCDSRGKEVKKVISNQEDPLPSGFLIRRIAEEQKAKVVVLMKELRAFLEQYALADDAKRVSFFKNAVITGPDSRGQFIVAGSDVYAKGDKLKWWIDTKSYSITNAEISTSYKDVTADFTATYYILPGFNYMSQATIRIPSRDLVIKLKFTDFRRS